MVFALPGDPAEGRCGERPCPAGYIAAFNAEYNLDKPLLVQYVLYLGKLAPGRPGHQLLRQPRSPTSWRIRFPTTVKLALIALAFEIVIGISAGVLAGIRKGKFIDNLVLVSTLVLISIPVFVIGSAGPADLRGAARLFPVTATQGTWFQLIMPGFVLASAVGRLRGPADPDQPGGEPPRRLRADRQGQGPDPAGRSACTRCATR